MNGSIPPQRKKLGIDVRVVILSSVAKEGARITMECLDLGASDFVTMPSGSERQTYKRSRTNWSSSSRGTAGNT
jgi:chemotaxis response regulator CheB